jgi:hypothetical protein
MLTALLLAFQVASAAEPVALVPFTDAESITRLDHATAKADFFALAEQFEAQENGAMCGPTSAVIVLNALRANDTSHPKPVDSGNYPAEFRANLPPQFNPLLPRYTQDTFFSDEAQKVKTRETFFGATPGPDQQRDGGLQLRQLGGMLAAWGARVEVRVADASLTDAAAKKEIVDNLGRTGDFVVINYFRPALGQTGGGHISPLGAYDATSDSFLVLDVNAAHHPWVWVPAGALLASMRTPDRVENRGYLLISEGAPPPG